MRSTDPAEPQGPTSSLTPPGVQWDSTPGTGSLTQLTLRPPNKTKPPELSTITPEPPLGPDPVAKYEFHPAFRWDGWNYWVVQKSYYIAGLNLKSNTNVPVNWSIICIG